MGELKSIEFNPLKFTFYLENFLAAVIKEKENIQLRNDLKNYWAAAENLDFSEKKQRNYWFLFYKKLCTFFFDLAADDPGYNKDKLSGYFSEEVFRETLEKIYRKIKGEISHNSFESQLDRAFSPWGNFGLFRWKISQSEILIDFLQRYFLEDTLADIFYPYGEGKRKNFGFLRTVDSGRIDYKDLIIQGHLNEIKIYRDEGLTVYEKIVFVQWEELNTDKIMQLMIKNREFQKIFFYWLTCFPNGGEGGTDIQIDFVDFSLDRVFSVSMCRWFDSQMRCLLQSKVFGALFNDSIRDSDSLTDFRALYFENLADSLEKPVFTYPFVLNFILEDKNCRNLLVQPVPDNDGEAMENLNNNFFSGYMINLEKYFRKERDWKNQYDLYKMNLGSFCLSKDFIKKLLLFYGLFLAAGEGEIYFYRKTKKKTDEFQEEA